MGHFSHDKGERYVLGRLVELMAFNNQNYNIDPSWHYGITSVRIDTDGFNSNDNYIAADFIKTKEDIDSYLENRHNIKLASFLTDHGVGGRTMEYCGDAIKNKENTLVDNLLFIKITFYVVTLNH